MARELEELRAALAGVTISTKALLEKFKEAIEAMNTSVNAYNQALAQVKTRNTLISGQTSKEMAPVKNHINDLNKLMIEKNREVIESRAKLSMMQELAAKVADPALNASVDKTIQNLNKISSGIDKIQSQLAMLGRKPSENIVTAAQDIVSQFDKTINPLLKENNVLYSEAKKQVTTEKQAQKVEHPEEVRRGPGRR